MTQNVKGCLIKSHCLLPSIYLRSFTENIGSRFNGKRVSHYLTNSMTSHIFWRTWTYYDSIFGLISAILTKIIVGIDILRNKNRANVQNMILIILLVAANKIFISCECLTAKQHTYEIWKVNSRIPHVGDT